MYVGSVEGDRHVGPQTEDHAHKRFEFLLLETLVSFSTNPDAPSWWSPAVTEGDLVEPEVLRQ